MNIAITNGSHTTIVLIVKKELTPAEAFEMARKLCDAALHVQGIPDEDPDIRDEQLQARNARGSTWFEELYTRIAEIGNDWNREAIRRHTCREPGQYSEAMLDSMKARDDAGEVAWQRVHDMDY